MMIRWIFGLARDRPMVTPHQAPLERPSLREAAGAAQPSDVDQVDNLTILVIVLFALGVARAWEFTGGETTQTLLGTVATVAGVRVSDRGDEKAP